MLDFLDFSFLDALDILLVAILIYYIYKLLKGTVAINIFLGIAFIFLIWKITQILKMEMLSNILGYLLSGGVIALIIVFQQEIRKFLLLLGSTNYTSRKSLFRYFNFLGQEDGVVKLDLATLTNACEKMASEKTGAIIVIERSNSLDFLKNTGDRTQIELSSQILETIFFKNSPLHDGAIIIKDNIITATRVVLPVSDSEMIPKKYGLRHRAGAGISEKTDALVIVVSEQRGQITYIKDGEFINFTSVDKLKRMLSEELSF